MTPEQARHETLAAAVAVAAAVSDQWFVVPPHTDEHPTVVLPIAARRPFLQQLKDADLPAYVSVHEPEHKGWPSRRGLPPRSARAAPRPHRPAVARAVAAGRDGASHLGHGCAVAVEFWEEGPDGDLHSPGQAAYTTAVPRSAETVTTRVHDVEVRTLPLMVEPTAYECTFPVDVVYTWVDGNDPEWNAAASAGWPRPPTRPCSPARRAAGPGSSTAASCATRCAACTCWPRGYAASTWSPPGRCRPGSTPTTR